MASSYRAEKSGFAKDAHDKLVDKYDAAMAAKVLNWIKLLAADKHIDDCFRNAIDKIPDDLTEVDSKDFASYLQDGYVFGALISILDSSNQALQQKNTWKDCEMAALKIARQRERISLFQNFALSYGVCSSSVFQTDELYESMNLQQVSICLQQLGTEAQSKDGYCGPAGYWLQKHKENKRNFTEDKLRQSENIIGLQAGYNKGANASGISFGSRRQIN